MRHTTRTRAGGIIIAAGFVLAGVPLFAIAEETSGELEIEAGLNEAMSVVCDQPLKFGVTSIRSGDRGGDTTVELDRKNNDTNLGGNSTNVSADTTQTAQKGECTLYGSGASDGSTITVTFDSSDVLLGKDESSSNAPDKAADGISVGEFTATSEPDLTQEDNGLDDGSAPFTIGGTLSIPGTLDRETIGDYSGTVTVNVSDEI